MSVRGSQRATIEYAAHSENIVVRLLRIGDGGGNDGNLRVGAHSQWYSRFGNERNVTKGSSYNSVTFSS